MSAEHKSHPLPFRRLTNPYGANYCYLNSVVQLFLQCSGVVDLVESSRGDAPSPTAAADGIHNGDGGSSCPLRTFQVSVEEYRRAPPHSVVELPALRTLVSQLERSFRKGVMNDASEVLECLLDALEADLRLHERPVDGCSCLSSAMNSAATTAGSAHVAGRRVIEEVNRSSVFPLVQSTVQPALLSVSKLQRATAFTALRAWRCTTTTGCPHTQGGEVELAQRTTHFVRHVYVYPLIYRDDGEGAREGGGSTNCGGSEAAEASAPPQSVASPSDAQSECANVSTNETKAAATNDVSHRMALSSTARSDTFGELVRATDPREDYFVCPGCGERATYRWVEGTVPQTQALVHLVWHRPQPTATEMLWFFSRALEEYVLLNDFTLIDSPNKFSSPPSALGAVSEHPALSTVAIAQTFVLYRGNHYVALSRVAAPHDQWWVLLNDTKELQIVAHSWTELLRWILKWRFVPMVIAYHTVTASPERGSPYDAFLRRSARPTEQELSQPPGHSDTSSAGPQEHLAQKTVPGMFRAHIERTKRNRDGGPALVIDGDASSSKSSSASSSVVGVPSLAALRPKTVGDIVRSKMSPEELRRGSIQELQVCFPELREARLSRALDLCNGDANQAWVRLAQECQTTLRGRGAARGDGEPSTPLSTSSMYVPLSAAARRIRAEIDVDDATATSARDIPAGLLPPGARLVPPPSAALLAAAEQEQNRRALMSAPPLPGRSDLRQSPAAAARDTATAASRRSSRLDVVDVARRPPQPQGLSGGTMTIADANRLRHTPIPFDRSAAAAIRSATDGPTHMASALLLNYRFHLYVTTDSARRLIHRIEDNAGSIVDLTKCPRPTGQTFVIASLDRLEREAKHGQLNVNLLETYKSLVILETDFYHAIATVAPGKRIALEHLASPHEVRRLIELNMPNISHGSHGNSVTSGETERARAPRRRGAMPKLPPALTSQLRSLTPKVHTVDTLPGESDRTDDGVVFFRVGDETATSSS